MSVQSADLGDSAQKLKQPVNDGAAYGRGKDRALMFLAVRDKPAFGRGP
jgi:hypothetical protein